MYLCNHHLKQRIEHFQFSAELPSPPPLNQQPLCLQRLSLKINLPVEISFDFSGLIRYVSFCVWLLKNLRFIYLDFYIHFYYTRTHLFNYLLLPDFFFSIRKKATVQFSHSVVSNSSRPHESQHTRPPCPSPAPGVHSDSRPSSQ